jgi:hypothetical protein
MRTKEQQFKHDQNKKIPVIIEDWEDEETTELPLLSAPTIETASLIPLVPEIRIAEKPISPIKGTDCHHCSRSVAERHESNKGCLCVVCRVCLDARGLTKIGPNGYGWIKP